MLKLENLTKVYHTTEVETRALDRVSVDEPTGNLDTANGEAVMDLLTDVSQSGTAVIMVTHSLVHAGRAQRTVKLLDGQVVSETLLAA